MRFRGAALPLGLFVLAAAWPTPLLVVNFSWTLLATAGAFFGTVGAVGGTVAWWLVVGDAPTPHRGAVTAAMASLATAALCVPVLSGVVRAVAWTGLVAGLGGDSNPIVGAMLLGLVALVLSPLAAALGYWVGSDPARAPVVPELGTVDLERLRATPSTRTLAIAFALLALAVVGTAAVQYADPARPETGDAPRYAGPDAPADTQVRHARNRTRSLSHTVRWTAGTVENGSRVARNSGVVHHDRQRDVIRYSLTRSEETSKGLLTVDGQWTWAGDDQNPPKGEMERYQYPAIGFSYIDPRVDARASITNRSSDVVTVRYDSPGSLYGEEIDAPGNRTVRIDADTGRLLSVTDRRVQDDGDLVVTEIRFEAYGSTSVEPPATPIGPPEAIVRDLMEGPLNGHGTLHD